MAILVSKKKKAEKVSLTASDVMVKEVITIDAEATVKEAAEVMSKLEISSVIATKNGKFIGIVTERDLLKRIVAEGKSAKKTQVKDIMSSPLTVIKPDTELDAAARLMFAKKIKKLPIVDHDKIVGLLSLTDVARCQPHMMRVIRAFSERERARASIHS